MLGSFDLIGLIYKERKVFLLLGALVALWGLAAKAKTEFHKWHTEPLATLSKELKDEKEKLKACENAKKVEVFEVEHHSVFDEYIKNVKELEREKDVNRSYDHANYDWMYQ